jgi:hypothetical protein
MHSLIRRACLPAVLCAALALPAASAAAPVEGPTAQAAKKCSMTLSQQRNLGPTYVISLNVSNTTCRAGRTIVTNYYNCRLDNGGRKARCGRVSGYSCTEERFNVSRFSFDARATCRKGDKTVKHVYTQNT